MINEKIIFFLLIVISKLAFSQTNFDIEKYEGIWIAEDFYNSFEKTKNIYKSKTTFNFDIPVGLRINSEEIKNDTLNVGFSFLHDHLLHPEVSKYLVTEKDTISEQGNFEVYVNKNNGLNQFPTSEIMYLTDYKSIISFKKNTITLFSPSNKDYKSKTIKYIRINKGFETNYKYPNPLYYYTRYRLLKGSYVIKDSIGKIISNSLKIEENGLISGFPLFNNKYIFYSTDIFCGPPQIDELVLICDKINNYDTDCSGYVFKLINNKTIHLYKRYPRNKFDEPKEKLGSVKYILNKKM